MTLALATISDGRARQSGHGRSVGASASAAVSFTLPIPPSVNELFRNVPGKGRVKTRVYDDWRAHAKTALRLQALAPVAGHVLIRMNIEMVGNRGDLDNRVKAIFDAIVDAKLIADDSLVSGFLVGKLPPANGLAHVEILPAQAVTVQFRPSHDASRGGWYATEAPHTTEKPHGSFDQ